MAKIDKQTILVASDDNETIEISLDAQGVIWIEQGGHMIRITARPTSIGVAKALEALAAEMSDG